LKLADRLGIYGNVVLEHKNGLLRRERFVRAKNLLDPLEGRRGRLRALPQQLAGDIGVFARRIRAERFQQRAQIDGAAFGHLDCDGLRRALRDGQLQGLPNGEGRPALPRRKLDAIVLVAQGYRVALLPDDGDQQPVALLQAQMAGQPIAPDEPAELRGLRRLLRAG
jgi:hypothetical protein